MLQLSVQRDWDTRRITKRRNASVGLKVSTLQLKFGLSKLRHRLGSAGSLTDDGDGVDRH